MSESYSHTITDYRVVVSNRIARWGGDIRGDTKVFFVFKETSKKFGIGWLSYDVGEWGDVVSCEVFRNEERYATEAEAKSRYRSLIVLESI
jgi:hypothetical protein